MKSIEVIVPGIESESVEFKQQPNAAMYKTLSAFSNTNGGIVLIGVSDTDDVLGCRCENSDLKELADTIISTLGIQSDFDPVELDGKMNNLAILRALLHDSMNPGKCINPI